MCEVPLTYEQQLFAAEHHGLVYKFLNEHRLSEDEFYDVVIFGYLKAVRDYLSRPKLQRYSFATIGWRIMARSLSNYYKAQYRQKRNAEVISIHASLYEDGLPLEQMIPATDTLMLQLESDLLMHELASRLSRQQMDMVRQKTSGYGVRDIARRHKTTIKQVQAILEEVRGILLQLSCE